MVEQKGLDFQIQIFLPLYTGISLSELCALKWEDIDMENRKIHIHRNLVRIQKRLEDKEIEDSKNAENITGSNDNSVSVSVNTSNNIRNANNTKNGKRKAATVLTECELPEISCREFTMPEKVHTLLSVVEIMKKPTKETYVAKLEKKKGKGKKKPNSINATESYDLDTDKKTSPPDTRSLQYRLKMIEEEVGVSDLTYQMLRDTFAMLSLTAGGDAYSVAYVMGVGVNVICDRYGAWIMKDDGFMKGIG